MIKQKIKIMKPSESSERLAFLIRGLYNEDPGNWDDSKSRWYATNFYRFYQNGGNNLYRATYDWFTTLDRDQLQESSEIFEFCFSRIEQCFERENSPHLGKLMELHDNILLEIARSYMQSAVEKSVDSKLKEADEKLKDILKIRYTIEEMQKKYEEDRKELSSQTITILSIFTGIAMAFFGGFSLLGSAFSSMAYGVPAVTIIALVVGFVLFNTVFMFLYMAGKLSGRTVSVCRSVGCDNCPERKKCTKGKTDVPGFWKRGAKRYPYVVAVNISLLLLLLVFALLFIFLPNHGAMVSDTTADGAINQQQIQQSTSYSELPSSVSRTSAVPDSSSESSSVPSSTLASSAAPSSKENIE